MVYFFSKTQDSYFAVGTSQKLNEESIKILSWLFSGAKLNSSKSINGIFIGPRREMITPWSTNAVEISQNCGISGISRIELFSSESSASAIDLMLQSKYAELNQDIFTLDLEPEKIRHIKDIEAFNESEGLALNKDEIKFLTKVSKEIGRSLTDSEVFGFSQINSEHCRHKIFNGSFILDGVEQSMSLFEWIKKTSKDNPNLIVSAYKDNVAFIKGPNVEQFAPQSQDKPDYFTTKDFDSVISLKAETHNFPTTVEPFNGAATGSGGEIRDRLAGGQGSIPLAGTVVYMTSYPRSEKNRKWEIKINERKWLYQTPQEILIKASNGASDFGNKYGQPMIGGSLLTFEHEENDKVYGFDKVIMLAGGIGFAKLKEAKKQQVSAGEKIVVLGGDNYRIGMGGGAVSSVATGEFTNAIELNAVQRSNPEMQKRVANAVRAMTELDNNPIVSIHDHGAGGHLNCLSELVEDTGGKIQINKLPIGDSTLSDKEILSNESQERMGLIIKKEDLEYLKNVSSRERAPFYEVGETSDNQELIFENSKGEQPFNLKLEHLFGSSPKTVLQDQNNNSKTFKDISYSEIQVAEYVKNVLSLEAVGSKDWLTNKVDRSVTGKVAVQQTVGEIQVPLNNVAVMALDFKNLRGVATSIGHSPVSGLIDAGAGSRLSVAEALTNLVFAPLTHGLEGVSLSANWMWPAKNEGENLRLYKAVKEISEFTSSLGINIPTGKDSLSMTQKYPDGKKVYSPGTVIISSVGEVDDIRKVVLPAIDYNDLDSELLYIDFSGHAFNLGGSSFAQTNSRLGISTPDVSPDVFRKAFTSIQKLIKSGLIKAGHDVSAGGLITTLLEMNFPNAKGGMTIDLSLLMEKDIVKVLFSEKPAIIIQVNNKEAKNILKQDQITFKSIGKISEERVLTLKNGGIEIKFDLDEYRDIWMHSSFLLDKKQSLSEIAEKRYENYKRQILNYAFPASFDGSFESYGLDLDRKKSTGIKAAIIREKGVNGDREMAYALWMAGFDVKDVHMTDLISGRENLSDVNVIVFVGGFSNSDVLGSAKGWAGSFLFNPKAKETLDRYYERNDTLSLGVCNGCQLLMELEKVYPKMNNHPKMSHNPSGKFESAFVNVTILENKTVMFGSLSGSTLGIWLAHGEGRFNLAKDETEYSIPVKYTFDQFPGNPNGSDYSVAALASKDGRHVAIMPHLERSIFPWNWAHYQDKLSHEVTPWIEPFVNAKNWVKNQMKLTK